MASSDDVIKKIAKILVENYERFFKRGEKVMHKDGRGPFIFLIMPMGLDDDGDHIAVVEDLDGDMSYTFKYEDIVSL